jgi:hypothetical protein
LATEISVVARIWLLELLVILLAVTIPKHDIKKSQMRYLIDLAIKKTYKKITIEKYDIN